MGTGASDKKKKDLFPSISDHQARYIKIGGRRERTLNG